MTTKYTYPVREGEITDFSTFAWYCAKEFCAFILDRGNNRPIGWIPTEAELAKICGDNDEYLEQTIEYTKKELLELHHRSDDAWREAYSQFMECVKSDYEHRIATNKLRYDRYTSMLSKVVDWIPPTPEHSGIKEFMMEQLKESLDTDIFPPNVLEPGTLEDFEYKMISNAQRNLIRYEENELARKKAARERREWIMELARSLGQEIR